MIATVTSRNGVPIRLTPERWDHIIDEHGEIAGLQDAVLAAVSSPERILAGGAGELLAVRSAEPGKWLVVVYREEPERQDGFVITAFLTRRYRSLDRRTQLWP
jgi:hypothetical protein